MKEKPKQINKEMNARFVFFYISFIRWFIVLIFTERFALPLLEYVLFPLNSSPFC